MTSSIFYAVRILAAIAPALIGTCGSTRPDVEYRVREPEYSIGFYNATSTAITDCKLDWKDHGTPQWSGGGIIPPSGFKAAHFERDPIPEKATLSWNSADGRHHSQDFDVAKRVPDVKRFSGTIWFRIDDHGAKVVPLTYEEEDRRASEEHKIGPD